jgi:ABC-type cobalamin/Fe3+-siderophores transport system ATPase subunit
LEEAEVVKKERIKVRDLFKESSEEELRKM